VLADLGPRRVAWRARARRRGFDPGWFPLAPAVERRRGRRLDARWLGGFDAVVASSWQTAAAYVDARPVGQHGVYLVQGHETWSGPARAVEETWRAGLFVVAVSSWLGTMVAAAGAERVAVVHSGIEPTEFAVDGPPAAQRRPIVGMVWHPEATKGGTIGLAALTKARAVHPSLRVQLVSGFAAPAGLPDWMTFRRHPWPGGLRAFYNDLAVYLCPSTSEGWGLPSVEAMACGAALVTTDLPAATAYAVDEVTALVCPIDDADALARAIGRLMEDLDLRARLADAGRAVATGFTWTAAVDAMEAILEGRG
jgi:hypothetical protein